MNKYRFAAKAMTAALPLMMAFGVFAQDGAGTSPLILKEVWKAPSDVEHPAAQDSLDNQNLELKLYGAAPGGHKPDHGMWIVKHNPPIVEPAHLWTGLCEASCAFAVRDKGNFLDLSCSAKVRFQYKEAGFHMLRPIVKLADGTWLAGDHAVGISSDWHDGEVSFADVRWRKLDIKKVIELADGKWIDHPDLSKVDEIGFTDLMAGSGHGPGGWSDIGAIEVYGKLAKRDATTQSKLE